MSAAQLFSLMVFKTAPRWKYLFTFFSSLKLSLSAWRKPIKCALAKTSTYSCFWSFLMFSPKLWQ